MPFVTMTAPAVSDPTRQDWAGLVSDNLNFLSSVTGETGGLQTLVNGSFEVGTAADTAPAGWALSIAAGNSTAFVTATANVAHGRQSFSMTTPGSVTGGVSLTSDFYLCATAQKFRLRWLMKATSATTAIAVQVKWYDEAESILSTDDLYNASTGNPTSWLDCVATCTPPTSARLFKIVLTGVNNSTAATVYFDGAGLFDDNGLGMTIFTSTGTFTPSPGVTKIKARMWGGGGGGGGGGIAGSSGTNGVAGGDSWVGSSGNKAVGGIYGAGAGAGGGGGAAVGFSVSGALVTFGGRGGVGGGVGGGSGGAPSGVLSIKEVGIGVAAAANTGGGGGGGDQGTQNGYGGGGAAGTYAEMVISVSSASALTVTVGAGGTGGTGQNGGVNGGAGGSGLVIVEEIG